MEQTASPLTAINVQWTCDKHPDDIPKRCEIGEFFPSHARQQVNLQNDFSKGFVPGNLFGRKMPVFLARLLPKVEALRRTARLIT